MRGKFEDEEHVLANTYYILQPLLRMLHAIIVFGKSRRVLDNLVNVLGEMNLGNRKSVRKMSLVLFILWLAINVVLGTIESYFYYLEDLRANRINPEEWKGYSVYVILCLVSTYIDFGCLFYMFNVYCCHKLVMNCLLTMKWSNYQLNDVNFVREKLIQLRRYRSLSQSVQDSLAILIVIWFADIFMAGSAMVIVGQTLSLYMLVSQLLPLIENVAMLVISVCVMDGFRDRQLSKAEEVVDALVKNSGAFAHEHLTLMTELTKCDTGIDACGLFTLNRSFLLAFLGSVISFTVLLIQITVPTP
ncbi:hypothetical protein HDE_04573 [Halotydeus destructor]|nr:hypothetical protein HDE_04573 [Halotydeus destructor]